MNKQEYFYTILLVSSAMDAPGWFAKKWIWVSPFVCVDLKSHITLLKCVFFFLSSTMFIFSWVVTWWATKLQLSSDTNWMQRLSPECIENYRTGRSGVIDYYIHNVYVHLLLRCISYAGHERLLRRDWSGGIKKTKQTNKQKNHLNKKDRLTDADTKSNRIQLINQPCCRNADKHRMHILFFSGTHTFLRNPALRESHNN